MKKHGQSNCPEYRRWTAMKMRCLNPTVPCFKHYGGRGIQVCERWRRSFAEFFADVGPRPSPKHTLERLDNNGHYEPGNVRWATYAEQMRNKRGNVYLEHAGRRMAAMDWAKELGVSHQVIQGRIKSGWDVARICTTPKERRRPRVRVFKFKGFGDRLEAARVAAGLSMKRLAQDGGLSAGMVSRLEDGSYLTINAESAVLLARALDVSVEWLVTGEERVAKTRAA
jgi:hypothetical protein